MKFIFCFLILIFSPRSFAEILTQVIVEEAKIYKDVSGTLVIKIVKKGEKVVVSDLKVMEFYPLVGEENAFIKAEDIDLMKVLPPKRFSMLYVRSSATLSQDIKNGKIGKTEPLDLNGVAFKYGKFSHSKWYLQYSLKYLISEPIGNETYRFLETGFGGLYTLIETERVSLNLELEANLIPHSFYAIGDDFSVHSFGASAAAGLNFQIQLHRNWALETYAQYNYLKFFGFSLREPYEDVSPTLAGPRFGLGLMFSFI